MESAGFSRLGDRDDSCGFENGGENKGVDYTVDHVTDLRDNGPHKLLYDFDTNRIESSEDTAK